jgi:bacillithiol system protein YtxJ
MGLRDRVFDLQTEEEVDEFLEEFPTGAIFKAGGCHKTMQAFTEVEEALDPYDDLHIGFIRVIDCRAASNHVSQVTGIQHESPQFILFVDGEAVFDVDNWDVTAEAIAPAVAEHLGPPQGECCAGQAQSDLTTYRELLERYVEGGLTDAQFKQEWLTTFRDDASPRNRREFDLLNGLFGDVDLALAGGYLPFADEGVSLKARAVELLEELA